MPDIDEENQACMPEDAPAPVAAPAPASAEPAEPSEVLKEGAEDMSKVSEGMETGATLAKIANGVPAEVEGPMGLGDRLGGALSLPGHILESAKGIDELAKGDEDGAADTITGAADTVSDVAKMAGNSNVAGIAGTVAGASTFGKGMNEIGRAIFGDDPAPGEQSHDKSDDVVNGINDMLHGGAGIAAGTDNPWLKAGGEALSAGMTIGDTIAPLVFGAKDQPGSRQEAIPEDGVFKPSTGNETIDRLFGVGQ